MEAQKRSAGIRVGDNRRTRTTVKTKTAFMRSIVITGASSGIGRATALRLAKNGWRVFAAVRKDIDAEQIEAEAAGALETVRFDVGNQPSIAAAAAEVSSRLKGAGSTACSTMPALAAYGEALRRMASAFAENEHSGSSPNAVARVVERALNNRKPRTRYPAGKDSAKMMLLARPLPEKLLDLAVLKTFGLPTAFGRRIGRC
jgi:NAD(P)-dependent dehydrogenase (short-subunit alcohol dehydrogenase family)